MVPGFDGDSGNPPPCKEIPGAGQLWGMPALRFILVGEMHGTREAPAIFADLVCAAGATRRPIVVGIERSPREQDAISAFIASVDRRGVTRILLSQPGWHSFDGRSSQAMLGLIEKLRAFKRDGPGAASRPRGEKNGWHRRSRPQRTATPTRS